MPNQCLLPKTGRNDNFGSVYIYDVVLPWVRTEALTQKINMHAGSMFDSKTLTEYFKQ